MCCFTPRSREWLEDNEELRKSGVKLKYLHHTCSVPDTDTDVLVILSRQALWSQQPLFL